MYLPHVDAIHLNTLIRKPWEYKKANVFVDSKKLFPKKGHRTDRIKMKSNLGTLSFLLCVVLTVTNLRETECFTGGLKPGKRNTVTFHDRRFFLTNMGFNLKYNNL